MITNTKIFSWDIAEGTYDTNVDDGRRYCSSCASPLLKYCCCFFNVLLISLLVARNDIYAVAGLLSGETNT